MSARRRQSLSPTLFPFLAVLVCTLGTLILLLALVAQKASDDARQVAEAAPDVPDLPELELDFQPIDESAPLTVGQVEDMVLEEEFRLQELVSHRDAQTADLEDRRDQLAHVEDHTRRIRERLKQISDAMERAMSDDEVEAASEEEIKQLKQKLASAEKAVKKLSKDVQSKPPRVVLIPYKGPNGTSRRPIYIECTAAGVTLQPENVTITRAQLENSDAYANPLGAALRAVRYHVTQTYGSKTPPYPMLIIRPDGVKTYYAARAAMADWDDQFGYELVPTQVELAFPTSDANLKERVEYAVNQDLELLARRSTARARVMSRKSYLGRVRSGQSTDSGAQVSARASGESYGRSVGQSAADGRSVSPPRKSFPRLSVSQMDRQGRQSGFSDHRTLPMNTYGNRYGGSNGSDATASLNDATRRFERQVENSAESLAEVDRSGGDQPFELNQAGNGSAASQGRNIQMASKDAGPDASAAGTSSLPTTQFSQSQGGSGSSTRAGSAPPPEQTAKAQQPPSETNSPSQSQPSKNARPQASRTGVDWALPSSVSMAHGNDIVRPIRVRVYGDQLILLPGSYERTSAANEQSFSFADGDMNTATLQMAAAVKERVGGWGAALPGGRWSPRLQVEVMPGAQRRAGQLQQLMVGSGLEIQFAPAQQPTTRQAITYPETRR